MKKIIPIALIAVAFGLVGCATKEKSSTTPSDYNAATIEQCSKCKAKKARYGKFGAEKNEQDFAK